MRKDIYERMLLMKQEGIKPNYAELARRFGCDYRTAKRYFTEDTVPTRKNTKSSLLDDYKAKIEEKVLEGCTASSIYRFIKRRGYKGKYTILREYVKSIKVEGQVKATMRFETNPGLQAQADWKESKRMIFLIGINFFNIFFINILNFFSILLFLRLQKHYTNKNIV